MTEARSKVPSLKARVRRAVERARRELRVPAPVQWNLIDPQHPGADFEGQHVLVTGAAGMIGSSLSRAFIAKGAAVTAVDKDATGLAALASAVGTWAVGTGESRLNTRVVDLRSEHDLQDLAASIDRLDVLVHNAATHTHASMLADGAAAVWNEALAVNVVAPAVLTSLLADVLAAGPGGSIVMVESLHGSAPSRHAAYGVSKAALGKLVVDLAFVFAVRNVRVNGVVPGWTLDRSDDADRRDLARQPLAPGGVPVEAITEAVLFLADRARSPVTTGQHLVVDGGQSTLVLGLNTF